MRMHHGHALSLVIDQLTDVGFAVLPRWLLLRAYDQERVTKAIWRDVKERLAEEEVPTKQIWVSEIPEGFLLVRADYAESLETKI